MKNLPFLILGNYRDLSALKAFKWWEVRRLYYNLILLLFGMLFTALLYLPGSKLQMSPKEFNRNIVPFVYVYAVILNVFYSAVEMLDILFVFLNIEVKLNRALLYLYFTGLSLLMTAFIFLMMLLAYYKG
ncbi:MAG: hypothetical protein V4543_03465 [Bacteroidota bacterium]